MKFASWTSYYVFVNRSVHMILFYSTLVYRNLKYKMIDIEMKTDAGDQNNNEKSKFKIETNFIGNNMLEYFKNGQFCDVILKVEDDERR